MKNSVEMIQAEHAVQLLREQQRQEIERAIDNVKRTDFDKWFRKEWYRAAAQRRRSLGHGTSDGENAQNNKAAEMMQKLDADWESRKARAFRSQSKSPLDRWLKRR